MTDSGINDSRMRSARPSWLVKQYCGLAKSGLALDLSCGRGGDAVYLAGQGFDVIALDIVQDNLERSYQLAENKNVSIDLRNIDPLDFKFHKERYSIIVADQIFQHLKKSQNVDLAAKIIYSLRKGGLVLGSALTVNDPSFKEIKKRKIAEIEKNCFQLPNGWLYSFFNNREVLDIFPDMQPVYYSESDYFESEHTGASWRGLVEFVFRKN
ncbi:MAG: class I SAM-dependent methyltransferase [candidate division Zixibacteria bacterium]|nr:class I SAM-dependent methyltransferase [candidate division Zixibacteria bacterium]